MTIKLLLHQGLIINVLKMMVYRLNDLKNRSQGEFENCVTIAVTQMGHAVILNTGTNLFTNVY